MKEDRLLTTEQVCDLLGKTPMMIYNYRKRESNPLPTVYLAGSSKPGAKRPVRFKESALRMWAAINKIPCKLNVADSR